MNKLLRIVLDKDYRYYSLFYYGLIRPEKLNDERIIKAMYKLKFGRELNLNNPRAFTEKIQWIKLYDHNPLYTVLADKIKAKEYVASKIGEQYVVPTYGVYDSFENIDFSVLPNKFVIKTNHDSGGVYVVKDKNNFDIEAAKKKITESLNRNYFYAAREWAYKNIVPKILIEEYLDEVAEYRVPEYKFFCFNGEAKMVDVCSGIAHTKSRTNDYCDLDLQRLPFTSLLKNSTGELHKPENYEKMIEFAEILSEGFPEVRMDFYDINGKIYFGEFTFTSNAGLAKFEPDEWDYIIGEWVKLPERKTE